MASTPPKIVSELAGLLPAVSAPSATHAASIPFGAALPLDYWKLILASKATTEAQGKRFRLFLRLLEHYGSSIAEYSVIFHAIASERLLDQRDITRAQSLTEPLLGRVSRLVSLGQEGATKTETGIVPFRVEDEGWDGGFMISRGDST